jgi:DNA processing protein
MTLFSTLRLDREHPDYPIRAAAMQRAPEHLFIKGQLSPAPGVAIVGTRAADDPALRFTRRLAAELASAGISIWSGGARGIDAAAHRGALDAAGRTVVVMGTGFGQLYPADHAELFEKVLETGGGWVSMFPEEQRGSRWTFLQRNALLAALVDAVVLVQAPLRSGARSTVAAARQMGKPVWVVPQAPWDGIGAGCADELGRGAIALHDLRALAASLGKKMQRRAGARAAYEPGSELDAAQRTVLEAVRKGARHPDHICGKTGLTAQIVAAAVLTLCLRNVLVQGADGRLHTVT